MNHLPIVVLPNVDDVITPLVDLLERQDLYFSQYAKEAGAHQKPIIFFTSRNSFIPKVDLKYTEAMQIGNARTRWLSLPFHIRSVLKQKNLYPTFIVAGTPFQPFLIAILLRLFFPRTKIHVSIHGELKGIRSSGFSSFVRFQFLLRFIRYANIIRFVSERQAQDFSFLLHPKQKVVVVPVPIKIVPQNVAVSRGKALAFLGRIHRERGIEEWVEVASALPELPLLIVGDGPEIDTMKALLPKANFRGFLKPDEVESLWKEVGVLLSTAPFESYGLAMREALLHGVPVVSRSTAGAKELQELAPNLISLYSNPDDAPKFIQDFLNHPPSSDLFSNFAQEFLTKQEGELRDLAFAWQNL